MHCSIRQALPADTLHVASILAEAADWLRQRGMPLWKGDEIHPDRIAADIAAGLFFLAESDGLPAGTLKLQPSDPEFWPDVPEGDALYLHRFAVRRAFAGSRISTALLQWSVDYTRSRGLRYLRLDTESARPKVRAIYENFGFQLHSLRQVGPYHVARYQYPVITPR